jgi:predicted enzyme related to lactoylglutathione lyase
MPPRDTLNASLIFINIPTENYEASLEFYSTLLGGDFARSLNDLVTSYHRPVSEDGIDVTITGRQDIQERCIPYFEVQDLEGTLRDLQKINKSVNVIEPTEEVPALVVGPTVVDATTPENVLAAGRVRGASVRGREVERERVGKMAVILDPAGNHVGLMELQDEQAKAYFRAGKHKRSLTSEQVEQHQRAIDAGERAFGKRRRRG